MVPVKASCRQLDPVRDPGVRSRIGSREALLGRWFGFRSGTPLGLPDGQPGRQWASTFGSILGPTPDPPSVTKKTYDET